MAKGLIFKTSDLVKLSHVELKRICSTVWALLVDHTRRTDITIPLAAIPYIVMKAQQLTLSV
jgi:hypothetical protein